MSDSLYELAVDIAKRERDIGVCILQRQLNINYGNARSLVLRMLRNGVIQESNGPQVYSVVETLEVGV